MRHSMRELAHAASSGGDPVQIRELARRFGTDSKASTAVRAIAQPLSTADTKELESSRALLLLDERGHRTWREAWLSLVHQWLRSAARQPIGTCTVLCVMFADAGYTKEADELIAELQGAAGEAGLTVEATGRDKVWASAWPAPRRPLRRSAWHAGTRRRGLRTDCVPCWRRFPW